MNVFLIAAISIDGYLADQPDQKSTTWTSPEDKAFYVSKIKEADAIVIGHKTFKTFTRYPRGSTWVVMTSKPEEFVNPRPDVITTIPMNASATEVIATLKEKGYQNVAITGGSSVYSQFMAAGVVDKVYLSIEPIAFGSGIPLFTKPLGKQLNLTSTKMLNNDTLLLEYVVVR